MTEYADDHEMDSTDFAHPAWWRGHEQTSAVWAQIVTEWLDGKDDSGGVMREPWQTIRERVRALVKRG